MLSGPWPSDGEQCGEAADQAKNLFFCAGPSEQRAADRSAARRSRSGGPKKI
ncbi:hypothetical protein SGRA_0294 [Saprospira grandis str. Lewin]|uniref:Uncharacterized protein n=1 Tax=Saprospira grandis (strain Lewin) TaxID=984262 RepID=H6L7K1_SAPGL|nr:hypothetical protein SGRA_0294 [Saprospira grandis str. Lewin]